MAAQLLSSRSRLIARHQTVGCSTGFMADLRDQWGALIERAAGCSSMAVELSAVSAAELPGLMVYLGSAPRLPFLFVSIHAPSKGVSGDEEELVDALVGIPPWIDAVVVHPDTIVEASLYRRLGRRLAIENMDLRKRSGHRADDLDELFDELPEARLCFDVAHSKDVDPTMNSAVEMLRRFARRLSHVHISSLDESSHHVALTEGDESLFETVLRRCRDVPWILEAPLNR